ncbi:DUF3472 domain-containing protein [Runella sp.]|uniref:DUF3472 domain-containing protein n=1 Tax=Runella sp. TaxID=1960881 RepID=UPI003015F2D4
MSIPLGGNAFQISPNSEEEITDKGIENWNSKNTVFAIYFSLQATQAVQLALPLIKQTGNSTLSISVNGTVKEYNLKAGDREIELGNTKLQGYNVIKLQGIRKSGSDFARIKELQIRHKDPIKVNYVPDNKDDNFHFGRRGPSVHLGYEFPENTTIKWFYNELTVPEGDDPIGSYYMANGFGEGYFGMQRNSATERKILFSVWSPFETDDPKTIPEAQRIRLLKKGKDAHIGEFGAEGSGGQSYLVYPWKPGTVYKFLNSVEPDGKGNTIYTAYFMEANTGQWLLIASFLRPQTNTWYQNAHSFLEIFEPANGYVTRKLCLNNQWACDTKGRWIALSKAKLTGDNNAERRFRVDFDGGVEGDHFFLKNGGFFNADTKLNTKFTRISKGGMPKIDFSKLP